MIAHCRQYAGQLVNMLIDAAKNAPKTADRLRAIEILLDRGFGKAPQLVQVMRQLAPEQVEAVAEAIIKKRRAQGVVVDAEDPLVER